MAQPDQWLDPDTTEDEAENEENEAAQEELTAAEIMATMTTSRDDDLELVQDWERLCPSAVSESEQRQKMLSIINFDLPEIAKKHDIETLKMLMFGPVGGGKTTVLNSVYTLLQAEVASSLDTSNVGQYSNTRSFGGFSTLYFDEQSFGVGVDSYKRLPVELFDTAGFATVTSPHIKFGQYTKNELEHALDGHLPRGFPMDLEGDWTKHQDFNSKPTESCRPRVLICIQPADASVFEKTKKAIAAARERGLAVVLWITKLDATFPCLTKRPQDLYRLRGVIRKVDHFAEAYGIPRNNVLPVLSYHDKHEKDPSRDLSLAHAMHRSMTCGVDSLRRRFVGDRAAAH